MAGHPHPHGLPPRSLAPVPSAPLRVGFERTVLELDRGGSARAARGLRAGLEALGGVQLIDLRQPDGRGTGRLARGVARELRYLPRELPRLARALDLDLLHCPAALPPGRSEVPVVVTVNDALAWDHPRWLGAANLAQQRTTAARGIRAAAHVITPSAFSRDRIIARLGVAPERISVVPYGIDERFTPGAPDPLILERLGLRPGFVLCVGTLGPRKNIGAAITAFEQAAASLPGVQLAIAGGPGPEARRLARQLRRSPVRDRIRALGRVSDPELLTLYRGASCLLFPSRYEGFGFPPLEAMACGTPVIAAATGAAVETIAETGLLVETPDPEPLDRALRALAGSASHRQELAEAGLDRARSFDWERCARATAAAYAAVVER